MMDKTHFSLALVTGASSGIGMAVARLLAKKGIALILTGRNAESLQTLASELNAEVLIADLRTPEGRAHVVECIYRKAPDLVINNAGLGYYGPALTYETKDQLEQLEVDAHAVLELTLEAARSLVSREKPGVILNVSSAAAFPIMPGFAVYSASKAFVNQFSEAFDEEVRPYGIRVLTACPGVVATHFQQRASGLEHPPAQQIEAMTSEYAAEQIWKQIVARKKIHLFDWHYRLMAFLVRYIIPKRWVVSIVQKNLAARSGNKEIKKIPHAYL